MSEASNYVHVEGDVKPVMTAAVEFPSTVYIYRDGVLDEVVVAGERFVRAEDERVSDC